MTAFAAALGTLNADPNLRAEATYRPVSGASFSVAGVRFVRQPDAGGELLGTGASQPAHRFDVAVADMAGLTPRRKDVIDFDGGDRFAVTKAEKDAEGVTWMLDIERKD